MELLDLDRGVKLAFLHFSRLLGLFYLSRRLSRRALRVICYHGFVLADEHLFRPSLFIKPETFARRLAFLLGHRFPVISLETAVERLKTGTLPNCATVITIDDGFYSTHCIAREMLKNFSFPATLYVTTYHCVKETPVFRLVVQYMFWKTRVGLLDISKLDPTLDGKFCLADEAEKDAAMWNIIQFGENIESEERRLLMEHRLGELLGVDFEAILKTRGLGLVTREEIRLLMADGVDIQLHTHRHRLPLDKSAILKELAENKAILEPLTGKALRHFCYPSGKWSHDVLPILANAGMKSAVTCDRGLNYPTTDVLALNRFLDGEHISQIEFEAEAAGYMELLRRLRSRIRNMMMAHS